MACPACGTALTALPDTLAQCEKCATVFDPAAQGHPSPAPTRGEAELEGLTVVREGATARATLVWWKAWRVRPWAATTVTVLHLGLIALGLSQRAWGPVALLALLVAMQLVLYTLVLRRKTTVGVTPQELSVAHVAFRPPPPLSLPRAQISQLFVLEVTPRGRDGRPLSPKKRRTRVFALCAMAPKPMRVVDLLPSAQYGFVLEDVARVVLGVPASSPVKGSVGRG